MRHALGWSLWLTTGCFAENEDVQSDDTNASVGATSTGAKSVDSGNSRTVGDGVDPIDEGPVDEGPVDEGPEGGSFDEGTVPGDSMSLYDIACDAEWDSARDGGDVMEGGCLNQPMPGYVTPIEEFNIDGQLRPALRVVPQTGGDLQGRFLDLDVSEMVEPEFRMELACPPDVDCSFEYGVAIVHPNNPAEDRDDSGIFMAGDTTVQINLPIGDPTVDVILAIFHTGVMPPNEHGMFVDPRIVDAG